LDRFENVFVLDVPNSITARVQRFTPYAAGMAFVAQWVVTADGFATVGALGLAAY
jgi:hypothetical protein